MTDEAGNADEPQQPDESRRAVFRVPGIALLAVIILLFCVTPAAFALPGLQALYLVPLGLTVWIIRTRTVATREGLTVRTMFRTRHLPWTALKGLALTERSKVRAVLADDSRIALPAVRTRHLPVLALVSEGRLPDPSGVLAEEGEQPGEGEGDQA
ncbi:PH domain-containing protein [Qaidamihabitans albus]|uniref:PH domain-containing protein n=1 Tax=Qaidamihabitans albus TaxID=2795733 RepID=UPI0027DC2BB4|nr:PH domain-containing protein [Qaidamihabitans albus]